MSAEARLRAKADATKQSSLACCSWIASAFAEASADAVAEPVIARAFARPFGAQ
jgi:hypothetical protein